MARDIVLSTSKLCKRFGGLAAVADLDLAIEANTIHSIIGPNGAGKTTAFNIITQNQPPTSGEVVFNGERLNGYTPDRVAAAGISRTYQNIRLFRNITAIENLLVGMHLQLKSHWWGAILNTRQTRDDEARAQAEAVKLLRFVGLRGRGDMLARNLAYGEQRRLEIGRALATRPKLLMLDEPHGGHEPPRNVRDDRLHSHRASDLRHHHHPDRAPDARGDDDVGSGHCSGPRRQDR